ncbi:MAG: ABC transporter substrate-binding protein [Oscillospiraceae bacterium]
MKKSILALLLAACMLLSVLAGCANTNSADDSASQPSENVSQNVEEQKEENSPAPSEEPAAPTERTVVDSGGTEVTVPAQVETVMTFGSCGVINTLIETLGCGWMIANDMSPRFSDNPAWHYQYEFAPQMAELPRYEDASGEIDIENVVTADPDLIIVMQAATAETLREKGLNVLYIDYGNGKTSEALTNSMNILGEALGVPEAAQAYSDYIDEMVAKIADVTSPLAETDKKKVLYGNIAQYMNPHILIEWVIDAAGGISCTADIHESGSVQFTAEDVLAWNPDVIMMITDNSADLKADAKVNSVNAIANDQMFVFPTVGHFLTGSSEAPLGILWLTYHLYPELYTAEDLAGDIYYFYDTFFGYQMSDAEIDAIINNN